MKSGDIVFVDTGYIGTVDSIVGEYISVILRNGDMWRGLKKLCRLPQDGEDLSCAPVEIDRESKPKKGKKQ